MSFLSFFRIKPLYTGIATLFYKSGVKLTKSVVAPSVMAYGGLSMLLFLWLRKRYPLWIAAMAALCIMASAPIIESTRNATPDALSTLVLLSLLWVIKEQFHWSWTMLLLMLVVWVRIDNLIFVGIVCLALWFTPLVTERTQVFRILTISIFLVCTLLAFWVLRAAHANHGFENFYGGLYGNINVVGKLKSIFAGFNTLQTSHLSIGMGLCTIVLFYKTAWRSGWGTPHYIFFILILDMVSHYILFPTLTTRLFLPVYVGSVLLSLDGIAARIHSHTNSI